MVIVYPNQQARFVPYNPYAIEVNQINRNYYNYEGFRHIARYCRNREIKGRIRKGRKLEYKRNEYNQNDNLNKKEDLIVLNQVSIVAITDLQYFLE